MRLPAGKSFVVMLCLAIVFVAGAQEAAAEREGEGARPTEREADARPAQPAGETPPRTPDRQIQDAAVEALLGREDKPEAPARTEPPRREETAREQEETRTEAEPLAPRRPPAEPARTRPAPQPERVPEATVPEVPPAPAVPEPASPPGMLDGVLPADDAPTPAAPMDDYRAPEPDATILPLEADAADPLEDARARPASSPATAIVVGLIVLAVLLVALAAVVGVMAAQRAQAAGPPAAAPGLTGWAYLAAPNAPNISLHRTPFIMGSAAASDLRLADPKASPQHARIDHTEDGYILTDLNSANGTFLNGERIASPVSLRPGDEIRMGDIVVNFEVHAD